MNSIPQYCQSFWQSLVPQWIRAGMGENNEAGLSAVIEALKSLGWQNEKLESWKPQRKDANALKEAQLYIGRIVNPVMPEERQEEYYRKLCGLFGKMGHGDEIAEMADFYIFSRTVKEVRTSGSRTPVSSGTPKILPARKWADSIEIAYSRPADFKIKSGMASIYIDEVAIGSELGAIAGVVWDGQEPVEATLPRIHTHSQNPDFLPSLLSCTQAFPFIMPLRNEPGQPMPKYEEILTCVLQILLGWLISPRQPKTTVKVCLERYSGYTSGMNYTHYVRGRFEEASSWFENRFAGWKIKEIGWHEKDYGYIAWGDLLAYWYWKDSQGEAFANIHHSILPGFIPLSMGMLLRLKRLEFLEKTGGVGDILDLATEISGIKLFPMILADVKTRLSQRVDLQERIVQEMEARYQEKERDLRKLQKMMHALRTVVPNRQETMPVRTRLTWIALELQEANHDGDPIRIAHISSLYEDVRKKGIECDRELVAYVDANLAVHYADTFDFAQAKQIMERTISDPYFEGMGLSTQARTWSALGQYFSIDKNYDKAEECFQKAIALFQKDPGLSEEKRKGESDQTSVYRAINAMDGRFPNALAFVKDVTGDIVSATKKAATSSLQSYHHHLILRSLWYLPVNMQTAQDASLLQESENAYLEHISQWTTEEQHPWPLIEMYRALLLWKRGFKERAMERFELAITIATAKNYGIILKLIAAMIACAGWHCHRQESWKQAAEKYLAEVETALPKASDATRSLRMALQNPEESGLEKALHALPFNYH